MKARILSWDWREQPDLDELARVLLDVSGGVVRLYQVDTGCDEYAVVVADRELGVTEVEAEWRRRWEGEDR